MSKLALIKFPVSIGIIRSAQLIVPLLAILMTYYLFRHASWKVVAQGDLALAVFAFLLLGVLGGLRIRYSELLLPFSRFLRLISFAILVYLLLDPADLTVAKINNTSLAAQIAYGYWVAVFCAVLSLFRPAALLFPSFYIYLAQASSLAITGFFASDRLASVTLLESAQFLSFSVLALSAIQRFGQRFFDRTDFRIRCDELALGCLFIAISLHLSHYFWSGYEKLNIGEYLWTWARDNQTQNLVLSALYRGTLPSADFPAVTQWLFDQMSIGVQRLNVLSFAVQILAIVAVLHLFVLRTLSLLYDALHIGIYLATGLLLWPWVANNIAILIALRGVRQRELTWPIRLVCVTTIVLGGFQYFGNASRLAWWDLRDITGTFVQAQVGDDQWQEIPLSYFNSHGRILSLEAGQVQLPGHYSPTGWGATREYNPARMRGECLKPSEDGRTVESASDKQVRENRITAFLLAHHRKLLKREERYSTSHPYPSLRYLKSATFLPEGIERVKQISAYRFVMQSVCLELVDGVLQRSVVNEEGFTLNLKPDDQL